MNHFSVRLPNLQQNKSWPLFGGLLPVWSTTAFWVPAKPLHLVSMLRKPIRCTDNGTTCSQHWSTEWPRFFSQRPTARHKASASQGKLIGLRSLASSTTFTWPLARQLHLRHLDNFFQGKCVHNQQEQKMLSKSLWNPEARIFTSQESTNLFVIGKNVLIVMVPILINKDMVEPSYNDLKFTVQNCNYICTNLIG